MPLVYGIYMYVRHPLLIFIPYINLALPPPVVLLLSPPALVVCVCVYKM